MPTIGALRCCPPMEPRRVRRRRRRCRRRPPPSSSPGPSAWPPCPTTGVLRRLPAHGAEEGRPAVVEDPSVGRGQEVAARLARRHADDRRVEADLRGVAVVGEVAEVEQAPERGEHRVAATVGAGRHADHLAVGRGRGAQRRPAGRASSTARSAPRWRCRRRPRWCRRGRPSTAARRRRPGRRCGPCTATFWLHCP